jgi:hypothetical protein
MNASVNAQAAVSKAVSQPPQRRPEPWLAAASPSQRLTVWEERARKMGASTEPALRRLIRRPALALG